MKLNQNESQESDESDDYLIELMGLQKDFPAEAMEAYGKIYSRYWSLMFTIAKRVTKDEDVACDLVADTFNIVYNRASTFKKGKIKNPANISLSIKKWMTTIMERIFYDHFLDDSFKKVSDNNDIIDSCIIEKRYVSKIISDDFDVFIEELELNEKNAVLASESISDNEDSHNLLKVKEYMEKLPERERDIILTTYNYYQPNKYTPGDVLEDLVKKWGTTRDNIRKILEKFRKAIKEELKPQLLIRK